MSEQNKMLVRRAVEEVWNRGNFPIVDELAASDLVVHSSTPGDEIHGPEGVKQFYATLRAAFPDIHFMIEDQIAEGDRVVTRWTARATHTGEYQGISPTGKQFRVTGIDIDRIVNGKVVECWPHMDELGLLQQLGVVPTPGQAGMATEAHKAIPTFDPIQYKQTTHQQWQTAAQAWNQWGPTIEQWLGPATEVMLDMATIGSGSRVLDVAAGAGGQTLTAAKRVGPTGSVVATDIASNLSHWRRRMPARSA